MGPVDKPQVRPAWHRAIWLALGALALAGCGSTPTRDVSLDRPHAVPPAKGCPQTVAKEHPISVGSETSCPFGANVFRAYAHASAGSWTSYERHVVESWSPVTRHYYEMVCTIHKDRHREYASLTHKYFSDVVQTVDCEGGHHAVVEFSPLAVTRYNVRRSEVSRRANRRALKAQKSPNESICLETEQTPAECERNRRYAERVERGVQAAIGRAYEHDMDIEICEASGYSAAGGPSRSECEQAQRNAEAEVTEALGLCAATGEPKTICEEEEDPGIPGLTMRTP